MRVCLCQSPKHKPKPLHRRSPHFLLHGQESKLPGKEELPSHLQTVSHINEPRLSKHIQDYDKYLQPVVDLCLVREAAQPRL